MVKIPEIMPVVTFYADLSSVIVTISSLIFSVIFNWVNGFAHP
jgi:hypothetical protein